MTKPRERQILFRGEMVRAILDGRKTQTRRVIVKQAGAVEGAYHRPDGQYVWTLCGGVGVSLPFGCPFGQPGDRLWVRETWRPKGNCYRREFGPQITYRADGETEWRTPIVGGRDAFGSDRELHDWLTGKSQRWHPSIHMPRWASRITLEVTGVRVERLQDISHDDCRAEGIAKWKSHEATDRFSSSWDETYNKRGHGWKSNPWVWVIEFKRITEE